MRSIGVRGRGTAALPPRTFRNGHFRAKKQYSGKTTWFSGKHWLKYSGIRPQPPQTELVPYAYDEEDDNSTDNNNNDNNADNNDKMPG